METPGLGSIGRSRIHPAGAGSIPQEQDPSLRSRIHSPGAGSIPQDQDPSPTSRIPTPSSSSRASPLPGSPPPSRPLLSCFSAVPWSGGDQKAAGMLLPGLLVCFFFPIFYGRDKLLPSPWNSCGWGEPRAGRGSAEPEGSRCFLVIPGLPMAGIARLFPRSLLGSGKSRDNGADPLLRLQSRQILALPGQCWFPCWVFPRLMDHLLPSLSFISRDLSEMPWIYLDGISCFSVAEGIPAIAAEQILQLPQPRSGFSSPKAGFPGENPFP